MNIYDIVCKYTSHFVRVLTGSRDRNTIIGASLVTFLLFFIQFRFGHTTNSLLLLSMASVQLMLFFFLAPGIFPFLVRDREENLKLCLALNLLGSFGIFLWCGYIFNQTYFRLIEPASILSARTILALTVVLIGNVYLISVMIRRDIPLIRSPRFPLPVTGILVLLGAAWCSSLLVYFTGFYLLDTLLGLLSAVPVFLWAGARAIDAYWNIAALENS